MKLRTKKRGGDGEPCGSRVGKSSVRGDGCGEPSSVVGSSGVIVQPQLCGSWNLCCVECLFVWVYGTLYGTYFFGSLRDVIVRSV
jgi:hypothetical protein